jgi:hypothetical protein
VLERDGFFPSGNANSVEFHHADCIISYPSPKDPNIIIKQFVEVILIIDSLKATHTIGTKMVKGCDWISGSEMKRAVVYLDTTHIKRLLDRGIDIIAIFATPFNCKASLHALTIQWLCSSLPNRSDQESTQLYSFLTGLLSSARGGFEIARVGGSNGNAHVSKKLFQMVHLPGITPRKSCGVMWYPIGTKWLFFYVSPYKKKHTLTLSYRTYLQPMPGGQVRITKKKLLDSQCPAYLCTALEQFVAIKKAESPELLVSSLNRSFLMPSALCSVEQTAFRFKKFPLLH